MAEPAIARPACITAPKSNCAVAALRFAGTPAFAATYARRIVAYPDMPEYVPLMAIALTAPVIRLSLVFTRRPQPS
ncbi:MAG: hypothetical protein KBA31_04050 [Alphaproteobacteria bacterium]|nr:hypothetical protein [Alphaproteobacteria bacterium]